MSSNRTQRPIESPADRIRALQETAQSLCGANGYKALLKRFADALHAQFGVESVSFARLTGRTKKLALKRRVVKTPGLEQHGDETLERLAEVINQSESKANELREGWSHVDAGGKPYRVTVIDDPTSRTGCLVTWDPPAAGGPDQDLDRALLDFLVRQLQNEGRWYRKLDKTQSQLFKDDLTGLYNARYLDVVLESEIRRADRFGLQFCLLFIDLDGFKPVNDQHGHLSGSSCLKQVAEVIRDSVREVDVALRYGGDEFVVLLLGATSAKGMLAAERVRRRIEQKEFRVDGGVARLTASIGLAAYPEHGQDRQTLLKMADETMYNSKRAGKNRVTIVGAAPR